MARISDCVARGAKSLRARVRFAMDSVEGMVFQYYSGKVQEGDVIRMCDARHIIQVGEATKYQ
jgi:hypothetical protein